MARWTNVGILVPALLILSTTTVTVDGQELPGPVYLSLGTANPMITTNNTDILITAIGDDIDSLPILTCHTDLVTCCRGSDTGTVPMGNWFNPNGDMLLNNGYGEDFYIRRNAGQLIRLNRRRSATSPVGLYCCVIPTTKGEMRFCANLVFCSLLTAPTNGGISYSDNKRNIWTMATYSCDAGYRLVGVLTRTCDSPYYTWSGTEPTCEKAPENQVVLQTLAGSSGTETLILALIKLPRVFCSLLTAPTNGGISYSDDKRGIGTMATYSCDAGYGLVGDLTRTCDSADTWSGTEPTCEILCSLLTAPTNGGISYSDDARGMGTVATYSCDAGYGLVGDLTRTCDSADTWSGTEPTCEIFCSLLTPPANGGISYSDDKRGIWTVATYSCDAGYGLVGDLTRTCDSAYYTWTGTEPTCEISCSLLTAPTNGGISYSDDARGMGTVATYSCDAGYGLVGDLTRTCDSADTWSGTEPTCEKRVRFMHHGQTYLNNSIVAINDIGEGDNALLCVTDKPDCCKPPNGLLQGDFYYPDNTLVRNHAQSYSLYRDRGPQVIRLNRRSDVLLITGVYRCEIPDFTGWNRSIYINITDCGPLPNPANGQVIISSGTTLNRLKFAVYSCYTGYVLTGGSRRDCRTDGRWNSTAPTCVVVDCGPLSNPQNGRVDTSKGTVLSSLAMYNCNIGYMLVGASWSVCGPDGIWTPRAPSCPVLECGPLSHPDNGLVNTSSGTTYNNRATYTCDRGYIMNGDVSRTCQSNGSWSNAANPVCKPVDCGALFNPENGYVGTSAGTTLGQRATYICNIGYIRRGSMVRTCNQYGLWTSTTPSCDPVNCGSLSNPVNGRVDTSLGTTFQKEANYSCDVGYTLSGTMTRTCMEDEQWTPGSPTCPIVDCGPLPNPEKGHVDTSSGTTYNSVATYYCIEGYELLSNSERRCGFDGSWSSAAPSCVPVDCGSLPDPGNGQVKTSSGSTYNNTAKYSCYSGYMLIGEGTRLCQANTSWTPTAPYCVGSRMLQLKFGPTDHCIKWNERKAAMMDRIMRGAIQEALLSKGNYSISLDKIHRGIFSCRSSVTQTTFRTTITGTKSFSAVDLAEGVQTWVESGPAITVQWYLVDIDKSCPVEISAMGEQECD